MYAQMSFKWKSKTYLFYFSNKRWYLGLYWKIYRIAYIKQKNINFYKSQKSFSEKWESQISFNMQTWNLQKSFHRQRLKKDYTSNFFWYIRIFGWESAFSYIQNLRIKFLLLFLKPRIFEIYISFGISQKLNGKYKKIYALRSTIRWEFLSQATLNKYRGRLGSPTHLHFYTGIGAVHKDIFCPIFKSLSWNVVWLRIKFLPPALRNKNDIDPSTECNNWNVFKECFLFYI